MNERHTEALQNAVYILIDNGFIVYDPEWAEHITHEFLEEGHYCFSHTEQLLITSPKGEND